MINNLKHGRQTIRRENTEGLLAVDGELTMTRVSEVAQQTSEYA
jgi:hypothetical protein